MKTPTATVSLRPLRENDFDERYLSWFRDPDVVRFLDARDITRQDAIDHLRRGYENDLWYMYAICDGPNGRHVGNIKIGPIAWRHRVADLVTVIGDRSVWGRGIAREAIGAAIGIAFGEHNLRKLSASIDSRNAASIRAYTAAGFEIETVLKDQFMDMSTGSPELSDKVFVSFFNPSFDPGSLS